MLMAYSLKHMFYQGQKKVDRTIDDSSFIVYREPFNDVGGTAINYDVTLDFEGMVSEYFNTWQRYHMKIDLSAIRHACGLG